MIRTNPLLALFLLGWLALSCKSTPNSKILDDLGSHASAESFQAKDVMLGDIKIRYLEQGQGPLVILLHGFPEFSGIWIPYFEYLSQDFQVVAPDMRGYNLSSQPENVSDYQIEILMNDIVSLVKSLGHQKACLVGHDWGGLLSWYLAAHHPEFFSKVTIINAPHPVIYSKLYKNDEEQKAMAAYVGVLQNADADKLLSENNFQRLQSSVFGTSLHNRTAAQEQAYIDVWERGLTGSLNYYRAYVPRQEQLAAELPLITIPIHLIWGEKDHALSLKNVEGVNAYVKDLKITRYPDASHWITEEKVPELSKHILEFCRSYRS